MSKVKFDGEAGSIELERLTAKADYASSPHHKIGFTYIFEVLHRYMSKTMYPDLANEIDGHVAVKQLPVYTFLKTKDEVTGEYNRSFIGTFAVGADKGDKNWFGFKDARVKSTAIRLEGTDHLKGVGFNYPWEVNGVKNIRYDAKKEALCIVTGSDRTKWTDILEQSACGKAETEAEIEAYLEQEFKPSYDCAYRANPLLVGVNMTLDEINADVTAFGKLRRNDGRPYSYCEIWLEGEYDLYYLNQERGVYEKNGVNLYDELSSEEKAKVDAAATLDEKNQVFVDFRINRFKEEAPNYWHINDGLFQLVFLLVNSASDNGEKNMYPYKLTPLSEGGRWRFFQDDLDSVMKTDNQAQDTKTYSVELHDFTDDTQSAYVFKGEDNAYFQALELAYPERFKQMGRDMLQAMYDLSPTGTTTLDKLKGFYHEHFFSRAQEYFTKSAYNNDAEYKYEEAWNNKDYVKKVDIHPLAQSLGDHYPAELDWVEKRMIYLMSKFGFGGYVSYNDNSLGVISVRTQDPVGFTLTPAIDSYPAILGGQGQTSSATRRIKAGEPVKLAAVGGGNTNVYIVGLDWLTDIGDLKDLPIDPSSVVALNVAAKRLRRLKVGDENAESVTSYLSSLAIGQCDSLETVDARNLKSLVGMVDLSKCPRLIEALFGGTSAIGVALATGSKVERLQLPDTVTTIDLRDTKFLETMEYGSLVDLRFLRLENIPVQNVFSLLKEAYNTDGQSLKDIRLVGFTHDGDSTDIDMLMNLANDKDKNGNEHAYNGIDASGVPTTGDPILQGTLHLDSADKDSIDFLTNKFLGLTFDVDKLVSFIKFADPEVLRVLLANGVDKDGNGGITEEEAAAVTSIGTWFKGNTAIETFDEFEKFKSINVIGSNNEYGAFDKCTNLRRIVLPTNCSVIKSQCFRGCNNLEFINLENVTDIGQENFVGDTKLTISINTPLLKSLGAAAFKNSGITSIENLGNITKLGGTNEFGTFYLCQSLQQAVLPNTLKILGQQEFGNCTALTSIVLPKSITSIGSECFLQCTSLAIEDLSLPNLESLGQNAFKGVSIKKISNLGKIPNLPTATNSSQNFGKKDVLEEVVLPDTVITIAAYSFYGYQYITSLNLENIEKINNQAFRNSGLSGTISCPKLKTLISGAFNNTQITEVLDLGTITEVGGAHPNDGGGAFYKCVKLTKVVLPSTITKIEQNAFTGCSELSDLNYQICFQNITTIGADAFSGCTKLYIDTFECPNATLIGIGSFHGVKFNKILNLGSVTSLGGGWTYSTTFGTVYDTIVLPSTMVSLGTYAFGDCSSLKAIIMQGDVPCSLANSSNVFYKLNRTCPIYVPDLSVTAYREASVWSDYADRIYPMSVYNEGGGI